MINEASTKTYINNSQIIIAKRFLKLQTLYTNSIHDIIKVYDKLLDKESVLKILKNKENESLLKNEFKIIISLNSENIIRGYEFYKEEDLYFYSMEFIKNQFDLASIKSYVSDILDSFEYMHSLNFIHNDIKVNNFLFNSEKAILIDFSKAQRVVNLGQIKNEKLILSRFLIQWINVNLKIDLLGNPKSAETYIEKKDINSLLNMFYRKNNAI